MIRKRLEAATNEDELATLAEQYRPIIVALKNTAKATSELEKAIYEN